MEDTARRKPHNLGVAVDERDGYYGAYFLGHSSRYLPEVMEQFPGAHYVGEHRVLFPKSLSKSFHALAERIFKARSDGRDGPNWSRTIKGHTDWITDEHIGAYETKAAEALQSVQRRLFADGPVTQWVFRETGQPIAEGFLGLGLANLVLEQSTNYEMVHGRLVEASKDDIRTAALAICAEAIEVADELGWKPWKLDAEVDVERCLDEFADLTAFFGTMAAYVMLRCDVGPEALAEAYFKKTAVNRERFAGRVNGYGGKEVQDALR